MCQIAQWRSKAEDVPKKVQTRHKPQITARMGRRRALSLLRQGSEGGGSKAIEMEGMMKEPLLLRIGAPLGREDAPISHRTKHRKKRASRGDGQRGAERHGLTRTARRHSPPVIQRLFDVKWMITADERRVLHQNQPTYLRGLWHSKSIRRYSYCLGPREKI